MNKLFIWVLLSLQLFFIMVNIISIMVLFKDFNYYSTQYDKMIEIPLNEWSLYEDDEFMFYMVNCSEVYGDFDYNLITDVITIKKLKNRYVFLFNWVMNNVFTRYWYNKYDNYFRNVVFPYLKITDLNQYKD